jgi:hypothetical protein
MFNCNTCLEKRSESARIAGGCKGAVDQLVTSWDFSKTKSSNLQFYFSTCPSNLYSPLILECINMLSRWRNGEQFYNSGLFEYPAKFVELMQLIDNVTEEYQAAEQAKVKKYNGK